MNENTGVRGAADAAGVTDATSSPDDPLASVNRPSAEYDRLYAQRNLCGILSDGLPAVKANAATLVPRGPLEQVVRNPETGDVFDPWKTRIENLRYNGALRDAIGDVVGRVFAREVGLTDAPGEIEAWADDVDGEGNSLHVFLLESCQRSVTFGADFVLIDYTAANAAMSKEEERAAGNRVVWKPYPALSVIDWRREMYQGRSRYAYVRLRETKEEVPAGREWDRVVIPVVRVIRSGGVDPVTGETAWATWETYERREVEPGRMKWVRGPKGQYVNQVDAPVVCVPTNPVLRESSVPLLIDLAETVLVYIRKLSSLDNAQAAVGHPLLYWEGASETTVKAQRASFQRLMYGPTGSSLKFTEPEGKSWGAIEQTLDRMRDDMKAMAKEPTLSREPGQLTATGESIRGAKASSTLQALALLWEDAASMMLYHSCLYLRAVDANADTGWGEVELNKRFLPATQNVEVLKVAKERNDQGKLSDATLWELMQSHDAAPDGVTWEEEQERIELEGPKVTSDMEDLVDETVARMDGDDGDDGATEPPPGRGGFPPKSDE